GWVTQPTGYPTLRLSTHVRARPRHHVRRPRRSDPPRHPRAPREGRSHRRRARPAVRDEPAGHLEAPQGARAGRAHHAGARRAAPPLPARSQAARRGERLARGLPRALGGELRASRHAARDDETRRPTGAGGETQEHEANEEERMTQSLEVSAQGDREIRMSRTFDAPRAMVWEAYTTPELVKLWLGIRGGWTLAECEIDLRAGGRYRYVWRHAERTGEMGVSGEYLEVDAPARLV